MASTEIEFLYQRLRHIERPILFDIGAFQGDMCIALVKRIVGLRCYAFEPNPNSALMLRRRVAKEGLQKDVTILELAVFDKVGTATLKQPDTDDIAQFGLSTLGRPNRFKDPIRHNVNTTTVDEFMVKYDIENLDFLKIDAEGAEAPILDGAANTIDRCKPAIFIEMREVNTKQFDYRPQRITRFMFGRDYYCCSAQTGRDWYFWYRDEHRPRRGDL